MVKSSAMSFLGPRSGAEEGQNGSAEGKVWQIVSHLTLIGLPVSILPSFPSLSLSSSSQPALQSSSLPSFLLAFSYPPSFICSLNVLTTIPVLPLNLFVPQWAHL